MYEGRRQRGHVMSTWVFTAGTHYKKMEAMDKEISNATSLPRKSGYKHLGKGKWRPSEVC